MIFNKILQFISRKKFRYIRKGKCNHCGFYCPGGNKNEPREFLKWERNRATCKIYRKRPISCKRFLEAPPILTDKCGYYFIDTLTKRTLRVKEI